MRVLRVARRHLDAARARLRERASSAVASLLSSCAETVEELILDKWTAASLPPSVQSLPRLSRVRETRHEPRRGAECLPLLRAAPNLTHWLFAGVDGEVSMLALVCDALCDTDARPGVDTLLEYRCHALCQLHSEFAGFLARLAKDGLLDTSCLAPCHIHYGASVVQGVDARTTLLLAALDVESLEMVALLLRAGATPTSVCPAPLHHSPLARAVRDLRVAVDHFVANVNDADTSHEYTARTASWVSRRFAIASLLVWSVARARGVEAVAAAAASGDDSLVRDLLPRCAPFVQRFAHTSHSLFPRRWQRVLFGYLPPLLLRAHPGGFASALSLAECRPFGSDAGDAAAAALGFVTHGDAARCGRALAVRRAAGPLGAHSRPARLRRLVVLLRCPRAQHGRLPVAARRRRRPGAAARARGSCRGQFCGSPRVARPGCDCPRPVPRRPRERGAGVARRFGVGPRGCACGGVDVCTVQAGE